MFRASLLSAYALSARAAPVNVTTAWFTQRIDQYSWRPTATGATHYQQRYLYNDDFFRRDGTGCIFFYTGNEGPVELYANHTGLIWENAAEHGALIVFAEHRYYGESMPLGAQSATDTSYLSSSQALADYAALLRSIRENFTGAADAPAIAFGGSYGGVLSALFRAGWPSAVSGALAASAPLRSFPGQSPPLDTALYYEVISRNLGVDGGSPPACAENVRSLWPQLFADGETAAGRATLSSAFLTCKPVETPDDAKALAFYIRAAFDGLSMANYPYPCDYISFPATLPAFPVRVACAPLAAPITDSAALYAAVAAAIGTLYNATPTDCNDVPPNPNSHPADGYDGQWDWQQCTEMQPDSQWFETRADSTVFWDEPRNLTYLAEHCLDVWKVMPAWTWITTRYGLPDFTGASNIVFTNGLYDPWSGASLAQAPPDGPARDLIVLNISEGGHHLDLFFSNDADPQSVKDVRATQMAFITKWIAEARKRRDL